MFAQAFPPYRPHIHIYIPVLGQTRIYPSLIPLSYHLFRHAAWTRRDESKGVRVEQSVFFGVGEAPKQQMASRDGRPTVKGRQWTRYNVTVVAHGSLNGPSVVAWYFRADSVYVPVRSAVDGSPQLVLSHNIHIIADEVHIINRATITAGTVETVHCKSTHDGSCFILR